MIEILDKQSGKGDQIYMDNVAITSITMYEHQFNEVYKTISLFILISCSLS
jgi:hypothetical protein